MAFISCAGAAQHHRKGFRAKRVGANNGKGFAPKAPSEMCFAPKASKINPLSGLARIFGLRALVELFKSLMKFALVATIGGLYIYFYYDDVMDLARSHIGPAIEGGLSIVILGALISSAALIIIAAIDVPYQRFDFFKKLRMPKQEIKDEMN